MKLWTALDLRRLPDIFEHGLIDHYHEGIEFSADANLVAEYAQELAETEEALAFLEIDFPDAELDEWLTICLVRASDEQCGLEDDLADQVDHLEAVLEDDPGNPEIPALQEDIAQRQEHVAQLDAMETGLQSLGLLGYACLYQVAPISMIKILDPVTMLEAVGTGNVSEIAHAVDTTEAVGLESLGGSFWVWLMFLFQNVFAVARGEIDVEPEWVRQAAEDKAEARKARRRELYAQKKKARKKPRKKGGRSKVNA